VEERVSNNGAEPGEKTAITAFIAPVLVLVQAGLMAAALA
jgi:hypothetical protein